MRAQSWFRDKYSSGGLPLTVPSDAHSVARLFKSATSDCSRAAIDASLAATGVDSSGFTPSPRVDASPSAHADRHDRRPDVFLGSALPGSSHRARGTSPSI